MTLHPHFIPGHQTEWRPADPRPEHRSIFDSPTVRAVMQAELDKIHAEQIKRYPAYTFKIPHDRRGWEPK